tara:strand:- start:45 stop:554 length:510 start_codon:yes stop_codon:yes gene_type:complete
MTRRNRLKMDPTKTPETDLSGFQEQGGYIDQETIDQLQQFDKDKNLDRRTISNQKRKAKKQLKVDEASARLKNKEEMEEFYKGPSEKTIRDRQTAIDKVKGRLYGGPVEDAKRQDDMKRGDYLQDPENPYMSPIKNLVKYGLPVKSTYSNLAKVGVSGYKFLKLINQLN